MRGRKTNNNNSKKNNPKNNAQNIAKLVELNTNEQIQKAEYELGTALRLPMGKYGVTYKIEYVEKEFKIIIYMNDAENKNASRAITTKKQGIKAQAKKVIDEFKNKYKTNCDLTFKEGNENIFVTEVSSEALIGTTNNLLLLFPNINKTEFLKSWNQLSYEKKLFAIRDHLNIVLKAGLQDNFKELCKKQLILFEPILAQCYQAARDAFEIDSDRMTAIVENINQSINQYVWTYTVKGSITTEVLFNFPLLAMGILGSPYSSLKKARLLLATKTLLEDSIDDNNLIYANYQEGLNQCKAILNTYNTFMNIFPEISAEDKLKIIGNNLLFKGFNIRNIHVLIKTFEINMEHLKINISTFIDGANCIEGFLSSLNEQIELENMKLIEDNTVASEVLNEISDKESGYKKNDREESIEIENSNNTTNITTNANDNDLALPPVESNVTSSYCTLFSTRPVTNECKKTALELIQKNQDKIDSRKNREKKENKEFTLFDNKNQLKQVEDKKIISISCKGETREAEIFPLGENTLNLYLCCDMSFVKSGEQALLDAYQKTASQCKILKRNTLGSNGIKIYGSDFLIVKCKSNNKKNKEHLICFPHTIPGTKKIIFLPAEIISHDVYEGYLKDRALLKKHASLYKQSVQMSEVLLNKEVNENIVAVKKKY